MAERTPNSENDHKPGAFPWGKVLAGIAGSAVASRVIRRVPLGRIVLAAAPLVVAALQKSRDSSRR
jgi:hypothetical protein